MRSCGKRSFTRACKETTAEALRDADCRQGGSAIAGPPFSFRARFFLFCGGTAFLQAVLRRCVCLMWCFRGEFVVECVVIVVR